MSFFNNKEAKPWPNRVLVCSFLSDGKKRKKKYLPLYCQSLQYCTEPLQIWLTNCKTQPCCSDKLQKSARLLRQTAKLRGCMCDVNAVSCHPALCRPRASTFQNKSFTELLLFKVKAQVWNKILFVKKISL